MLKTKSANTNLKTLWVMRHGLAVDQFESDFTRELSNVGALQAKSVAEQLLNEADDLPTDMLVSPFCRTQSTAKIVHEVLGLTKPFETEDMLVHFADHKILGDYLLASSYRNLIIVSHMPIVAYLCQYLSPNCGINGFQTAQMVKLIFETDESNNTIGRVSHIYLPS